MYLMVIDEITPVKTNLGFDIFGDKDPITFT